MEAASDGKKMDTVRVRYMMKYFGAIGRHMTLGKVAVACVSFPICTMVLEGAQCMSNGSSLNGMLELTLWLRFRMFQGWLSMSTTSAGEGTLMVNPLLERATAYFLLRPFFQAKKSSSDIGSAFLDSRNWRLEDSTSSTLQGAVPSNCQELNDDLHPHLELKNTMVHIPQVRPGDYVAWHCDSKSNHFSQIVQVHFTDL